MLLKTNRVSGRRPLENSNFEGVTRSRDVRNWRTPILNVFCAGSLMLSVVMLTGLLQQRNSNFEGVVRRKFAAVGYRFSSVRFLAS
jgi:hypothetical protein